MIDKHEMERDLMKIENELRAQFKDVVDVLSSAVLDGVPTIYLDGEYQVWMPTELHGQTISYESFGL